MFQYLLILLISENAVKTSNTLAQRCSCKVLPKRFNANLGSTVIPAVLFAACGGGGGGGSADPAAPADPMPTEMAEEGSPVPEVFPEFQGSFSVVEDIVNEERSLELRAGFVRSETRLLLGNQLLRTEDQCQEVLSGTSPLPPETISAGDVIIVSNQDGTFAELSERVGNSIVDDYNQTVDFFTSDQITGLSVSIPGAEYPALPTISVHELDEIANLQPAIGGDVSGQTRFQWVPSSFPDTSLTLRVSSTTDTSFVQVFCRLVDDGEFAFPDFFQGLLGDSTTTNWSITRSRTVEHFENDAYLQISRTINLSADN